MARRARNPPGQGPHPVAPLALLPEGSTALLLGLLGNAAAWRRGLVAGIVVLGKAMQIPDDGLA